MQEPADPYGEWSRPLLDVPFEIANFYDRDELRDNAVRAYSMRAHHYEMWEWLTSYTLIAFAFEPGRAYTVDAPIPGSPEDSPDARALRGAFGLRLQLLGLAGRAAKPALDLILSGYYTEAMTLLRTMLDGWARCLFVRLAPREFRRWYVLDDGDDDPPSSDALNWNQIDQAITAHGSDEDRTTFESARLRWELLNLAAHPSGQGIQQVRSDEHDFLMFRPEYHHEFCMYGFSVGVFVMRALLRETESLGGHDEDWLRAKAKHDGDVGSLERSLQVVLEEMARRIERKREANRAAKRASNRGVED